MTTLEVTGVMSGSSLDGLDLAAVRMVWEDQAPYPLSWDFQHTATLPLSPAWVARLRGLAGGSGRELAATHAGFGRYIGQAVRRWHTRTGWRPSLVAVHGHTVFHEPDADPGFSTQIGDGAWMAGAIGCPVVTDFRNADIAAGGQGAPMAPLADLLLFPAYQGWLNLGGIANLTLRSGTRGVIAGDLCGANQWLNGLAEERGLRMDRHGRLAAGGEVREPLLRQLAALPWLARPLPRSLSNQQVQEALGLLRTAPFSVEDRLATACAAIAGILAGHLRPARAGRRHRLLVSGGGACNTHLMQRIEEAIYPLGWEAEVAAPDILHYKEALLMALAGVLRYRAQPNFICGATGARYAGIGGAVYLPAKPYLRS